MINIEIMIYAVINFAFYSGITLIILLGLKFFYELIEGKKDKYLKTLRLMLNFGIVLTFCFDSFISLALIVRPPSEITGSKEKSLENLSRWILNEELKIILLGLVVIIMLGFLNYLYQRKIEKLNLIKQIINLTLINCLVLIGSLLIIYIYTYNELAIEVGYYFK